ncbi:MAG: hypothetical protein ABGX27_00350 [Desulfurobacteriaceae bacterium]
MEKTTRIIFTGDGFNLADYHSIVGATENFVILGVFNKDWEKLEWKEKSRIYEKLDKYLYRIEQEENPTTNYYFLFKAEGKWIPKLVCDCKITGSLSKEEDWEVIWRYTYQDQIHKKSFGYFQKLSESRKFVINLANFLS